MKFDSNRAWSDAIAAVRANREVLLAVGGVFFMLPSLLSTVFLTDVQTQLMENLGKPEVVQKVIDANLGLLLGFGIGGMLVPFVGYLTVMALLSGRGRRPTVGQAISMAVRGVPTLLGATLIFLFIYLAVATVVGIPVGGVAALAVGPGAVPLLLSVVLILAMIYFAAMFSMVFAAIVDEARSNPFSAMLRSWLLAKGNRLRLFGFFLLLAVGYLAAYFMLMIGLLVPVSLSIGQGKTTTFIAGLASGAFGAVTSALFVAITAQIHRQLAGSSAEAVAEPFE